MLALTYLEFGHLDKAKAIAAELPKSDKEDVLFAIPVSLARAGRFEAAIREADNVKDPSVWEVMATVSARRSIPQAISFAEKVPAPRRSAVYAGIVQTQVLSGNLDGASATAAKVSDTEERKAAELWLVAGRLAECKADIQGAARKQDIDLKLIDRHLAELAESKARAGDLKKADQIVQALLSAETRCTGYAAIAERHLDDNRISEAREAIQQALKELSRMQDASPLAALTRSGKYTKIAHLQVRAGNFEEAVKNIHLAKKNAKVAAEPFEPFTPGVGAFEAMGGDVALIGLLIMADRIDEAVTMATRDDGTLLPQAVPLLAKAYAAKGRTKELKELEEANDSPEVKYQVYLFAAKGAAANTKAATRPRE